METEKEWQGHSLCYIMLNLVGGNLLGFRCLTTVVATDAMYTA